MGGEPTHRDGDAWSRSAALSPITGMAVRAVEYPDVVGRPVLGDHHHILVRAGAFEDRRIELVEEIVVDLRISDLL